MIAYANQTVPVQSQGRVHGPFSPDLLLALEYIEAAFWNELYAAAPPAAVQAAGLRTLRIGTGRAYLAPRVDVLALNKVIGLGLEAPAEEDALNRLLATYAEAGVGRLFFQVSPAARPPALYRWLTAHGGHHYNNWIKLHRPLDTPVPEVATDLHVAPIDPANAMTFGQMVAPHFDWPAAMAAALAGTVGRSGWRHYVALDGDVPVATAALFVRDGYAYFGPAATDEAHRRRGAQSALIARRLQDAVAMGCHTAITDTAEERPDTSVPSYRNMRRMGFTVAYARPNYLFTL